MDVSSQLTDSVYIAIWNDIASGGKPFWILLSLVLLFYFKDEVKKVLTLFIDILTFRANKKTKKYKQSDLKNHQLFKDLDYWLSTGIEAIHLISNDHSNNIDYIKGKEKIAKDVIKVEFETLKESFTKFINETDFDNIDYEVCFQYLMDTITKSKITQIHKLLKLGVPKKFLEKYEVFSKVGYKILMDSLKLLYQQNMDLDVPTRMYLSLSNIDGYLNICFNSISDTINSINGDLIGEEYDGHILGRKRSHILKPPSTQNTLAAIDKCHEILKMFNSSRVSVVKLHNIEKDDYTTGFHSCVYEVVANGVVSMLEKMQYVSNADNSQVLTILKRRQNIAVDITKFTKDKAQTLLDRGIVAVIMSPIFNANKLDGILCLDYFSLEDFNKIIKMEKFDEKLNESAELLSPYIIYPKDFKY